MNETKKPEIPKDILPPTQAEHVLKLQIENKDWEKQKCIENIQELINLMRGFENFADNTKRLNRLDSQIKNLTKKAESLDKELKALNIVKEAQNG